MMQAKRTMKAYGFTLIELLVVVSIIALLVSILLPALSKAREQAKIALCLSNMHQIGVASELYLTDNKHRFYEYWQVGATSPANREFGQGGVPANENVQPGDPDYLTYAGWEDWRPLNQFVKTYDVWKCPSDRGRAAGSNFYGSFDEVKPSVWEQPSCGASYLFNTAGIADIWQKDVPNPNTDNIANNADKIRRPAEFVVFYEYPFLEFNYLPNDSDRVIGFGGGYGGAANFHQRHFAPTTSSVVFADSHAVHLSGFTSAGREMPGVYRILAGDD